jgi:endogenous inhibitor of DNA gyrase (YacG/DUF329 family)
VDEHGEVDVCPHCSRPMPQRRSGAGRPARFCSDNCRKADHRAAQAARTARGRLPRLREYLDSALTDAEGALRRLHASGLDPDELLLRPGVKRDLPGDVDYAVRTSLERLRAAAREHREAVETAKRHPAGAAPDDDDD